MKRSKSYSDLMEILAVLALLIIGIIFIVNANWGLPFLYIGIIIFLIVMTISTIVTFIIRKLKFKETILLTIAHLVIIVLLIIFPNIYVRFVGLVTGLYALLNSIVYFIDYYIARHNHLGHILSKCLISLVYFIFAISLILIPQRSTSVIFIVSGIYLIVTAIVRLIEVIMNILNRKYNVAVSLPVIFSALIPPRLYTSLNKDETLLSKAIDDPLKTEPAPLEVFLYLRDGLFESLGHMDISFKGVMYSYGLHDPRKRRVFGSAGDGVLIEVERNSFLRNCLKSGKTIILDFKLYPTESDMYKIEKRIEALKKDAYPFICEGHYQELKGLEITAKDYISDVYKDTHCRLYKFNRGRFKTYFVFTTNCVMLADYLIRNKEVDLLNMEGIVTPGNYINYLYRLYLKGNTIVKDLVLLKKNVEE